VLHISATQTQIGYGLLLVSLASNSSLPLGVFLRLDAVPVGDEFTRSVLVQRLVVVGGVGVGSAQRPGAAARGT